MGNRDVLIVGHRGTGKTTVGRQLEARNWSVIDLDRRIEASEGRDCATILEENPEHFRSVERETLQRLADDHHEGPRIVTVGAGCLDLPLSPVVVWLRRSGWAQTARDARRRLRPELGFEAEVQWMIETREPVWQAKSDLVFDLDRGRRLNDRVDELETLLEWIDSPPGPIARKTWIVARSGSRLPAAVARARRLGLSGVEIRSDLIESPPTADLDIPLLASLRTDAPEWLRWANARADRLDVELSLAHEFTDLIDHPSLTLSSHPEGSDWRDALEHLIATASQWGAKTKFAPRVDPEDLYELSDRRGEVDTLIPQGVQSAWLRPILVGTNHLNFLAEGLAARRFGASEPPDFDLRDWLPHFSLDSPHIFRALVGDPAMQSQGDIWHRRAASLEGHPNEGYLKIETPEQNLQTSLELARELGIVDFSITSPYKASASELCQSPHPVNTLTFRGRSAFGVDTDAAGMAAQLAWIDATFDVRKRCALLGKGDVSPAALRGIRRAGWTLVKHRGAREGWSDEPIDVDLVINAAGPRGSSISGAPHCKVWLDLHYTSTEAPPVDAHHVAGDLFFAAQAKAQRTFWQSISHSTSS